jgi:predicted TIM-barrel fold metal-dependent hydrolase
MNIPNSSGDWAPRLTAPPLACDSHLHIYDPRFPASRPGSRLTRNGTVADYRLLQQRLGTSRAIVVQPAAYGFDNSVTVDAISQIGIANARGVAVIAPASRTRSCASSTASACAACASRSTIPRRR